MSPAARELLIDFAVPFAVVGGGGGALYAGVRAGMWLAGWGW